MLGENYASAQKTRYSYGQGHCTRNYMHAAVSRKLTDAGAVSHPGYLFSYQVPPICSFFSYTVRE